MTDDPSKPEKKIAVELSHNRKFEKQKPLTRSQKRRLEKLSKNHTGYEPLYENSRSINLENPYHPDYVFTNSILEVQHFVKVGTNFGEYDMLLVRRWDNKPIIDHAKLAQHILAQLDGFEDAVAFLMIPNPSEVEKFRTDPERSVTTLYSIMQIWISPEGMPKITVVQRTAEESDYKRPPTLDNPTVLAAEPTDQISSPQSEHAHPLVDEQG